MNRAIATRKVPQNAEFPILFSHGPFSRSFACATSQRQDEKKRPGGHFRQEGTCQGA